jgi:SAM-dependent methyltransferase
VLLELVRKFGKNLPGVRGVLYRIDTARSERDTAIAELDAVTAMMINMMIRAEPILSESLTAHLQTLGKMPFRCNICGTYNLIPLAQLNREANSCRSCQSSVRFRSIVHLLSRALYGRSMPVPEFPVNKAIKGAGLSDWKGYAEPLEKAFDYRNTYFHKEPFLDITAPRSDMLRSLDFLISSEVFEHVPDPVDRAFNGAISILKPGGHLILTVPFRPGRPTEEHYAGLRDLRVVEMDGSQCVTAVDQNQVSSLHRDPVFHGGPGQTLEMRVFGKDGLISDLQRAGFTEIEILSDPVPEFGLYFPDPWSLPVFARKPLAQ